MAVLLAVSVEAGELMVLRSAQLWSGLLHDVNAHGLWRHGKMSKARTLLRCEFVL